MCVCMYNAEVTAPISLCSFLTEQDLGEGDWKPASQLSSPPQRSWEAKGLNKRSRAPSPQPAVIPAFPIPSQ